MKTLALLLTVGLCGCSVTEQQAERSGAKDARQELASGTLALEVFGLRMGGGSAYDRYLIDRYLIDHGVEIRTVAGCMVNDRIIGHAEGFNQVMEQGIKDKFGEDVFEKAKAAGEIEP